MENKPIHKLINERINDYIFITSIEREDKASFRGRVGNLLVMLAYGLKDVVETMSEQDGAPSKPVLLDEAIDDIASTILKAWEKEEEEE